jgi:putative transposase
MGRRFPGQKGEKCFFATSTFQEWKRLGDIPGFYAQLADSLRFYRRKYEARVVGYVFMPSHLHFLLYLNGIRLGDFMRDFKKYVAQKAAPDIGLANRGIWMPRFDRVAIRSLAVLRTKLEYIHLNPVRAGLVAKPEDWPWSSARDYLRDQPGPVPVWKDWC